MRSTAANIPGVSVYPLGEPVDRMSAPPCGYWEKRWGGGRYVKSGLPDMRIVVKGLALEVELKATTDLDGIMDAWANDFAEKLDVSEEGVHE